MLERAIAVTGVEELIFLKNGVRERFYECQLKETLAPVNES